MRFSRFDGSPIVFFPTAWIVGNTQQPNSSLLSHRGETFPPGWIRSNRLSKSLGLKCTEHITECFDGCHFALFCFTKSTHFFLLLLASGRSSSKKVSHAAIYLLLRLSGSCNQQQCKLSAFSSPTIDKQWEKIGWLKEMCWLHCDRGKIGSWIDVTSPILQK